MACSNGLTVEELRHESGVEVSGDVRRSRDKSAQKWDVSSDAFDFEFMEGALELADRLGSGFASYDELG
jgi:hypothetical protein